MLRVAFFLLLLSAYSRKVQQRLGAQLLAKAPESLPSLGIRDLRVDVHRDVDLGVAKDPHSDTRADVERGQERGTGVPGVVDGDPPDASPGARGLEAPIEVPGVRKQSRRES
jgi:hypothetical protein